MSAFTYGSMFWHFHSCSECVTPMLPENGYDGGACTLVL